MRQITTADAGRGLGLDLPVGRRGDGGTAAGLRRQSLLMGLKLLNSLLRVVEVVTVLMSRCGWQRRLRKALLFAVATAVEIGLCQGLRLGGLAGRAAIDQYDVERTILESARGIREREVQRQHDGVQQQ